MPDDSAAVSSASKQTRGKKCLNQWPNNTALKLFSPLLRGKANLYDSHGNIDCCVMRSASARLQGFSVHSQSVPDQSDIILRE